MIIVDANLLLYAHFERMARHDQAREWLDGRLGGTAPVGLPWPSLLAFLRLATNRRVFDQPDTVEQAWKQVGMWLDCACVWIPQPTDRHREVMGQLLEQAGGASRLVADAHLAALAIEHGLTLCSADGDFARFHELRWQNPLSPWQVGERGRRRIGGAARRRRARN